MLIAVMAFSFTACEKLTPSTPQNVKASDDGVITWDPVENAIAYLVVINGNEEAAITVNTNSYKADSVTTTFTYSIMSVSSDYVCSEPTETFTFVGKGIIPKPDLSGVTVGIEGGTEIKAGKTLQLSAVVTGANDTSVEWSITKGSDVVSVDEKGLVTASETTKSAEVEVKATSKANPEKSATKHLTVVVKTDLTQDMLDAVSTDKITFVGYVDIDVYTIGLFPSLEGTYSMVTKTAMDGEHWYAEYENQMGITSQLFCANNNGIATQVGVNFKNEENYTPMLDDDGRELTWQNGGMYNNFKGLKVSDFTFDEETWRWVYSGADKTLPAKMIASANPYDFKTLNFSLVTEENEIKGIYAVSGDDYNVADGYRAIQKLNVALIADESVEVPEVTKYKHDDIHDELNQAIDNMKALKSYKMDYHNTQFSMYTGGYVLSGFVETVTADTMHFVPYDFSYDHAGEEVRVNKPEGAYGYHKVSDTLYNAYYTDEGAFVPSRAYSGAVAQARTGFEFAAEIFTAYYNDEDTGETTYYVDSLMCGVATEFYNCVGNDDALYGIFAAEGRTSSVDSFTPYVTVKDGYIVSAGFYYDMVLMTGVVELTFSDFNKATLPEGVSLDGFAARQIPQSWTELTIQKTGDVDGTADDTEVNAADYWKEFFKKDDVVVPFFGNVLGDAYGFGMTTVRKPQSSANTKWTVVLYYDVPLDIDYTITTSLDKVNNYLASLGYQKDRYGEYHKDGIGIVAVDNDLDLLIYVWADTDITAE